MAGIFGVIGLVIISECSCVFLAMNLIGQVCMCSVYAVYSTACALHVHCVCTACALHVHCMPTACALRVHCMCTACALHVHCMYAACMHTTYPTTGEFPPALY